MIIRGKVIHGRSLGHTLGFPTANIAIDERLECSNGVYRSRITIKGEEYVAISNLGTKPSVGGTERSLESHIIDFHEDIYGEVIEVELLEKLRDERRFDSIEALTAQVKQDIENVKNYK